MKISYYCNNRNPHKFLEVREYSKGTHRVAQFMLWVDPHHVVKNWTGCGSRKGNRHLSRVLKGTLEQILEDYTEYTFDDIEGKVGEVLREAVADRRSITYFLGAGRWK